MAIRWLNPRTATGNTPNTQKEAHMATRRTTPTPAPVQPTGMPEAWAAYGTDGMDEFDGRMPVEKSALVGVPFLIIGAEIERTPGRDYDVAWIRAVDADGTEFEFSDASSGVRAQIQAHLAKKGLNPAAGGDFQSFRAPAMNGLRFSEFEVDNPDRPGKKMSARTYYIAPNKLKDLPVPEGLVPRAV